MKFRLLAVLSIVVVAAVLPIIARQSPAPAPTSQVQAQTPPTADTGESSDKSACLCCDQHKHGAQAAHADATARCCHGKNAKAAHSMPCCEGTDAKNLSCCNKDAKDKQAAANCCQGKEGKMCAKHNGKDGCDDQACKSCCAKSTAAANASDTNTNSCCAGANRCCHHSNS